MEAEPQPEKRRRRGRNLRREGRRLPSSSWPQKIKGPSVKKKGKSTVGGKKEVRGKLPSSSEHP